MLQTAGSCSGVEKLKETKVIWQQKCKIVSQKKKYADTSIPPSGFP